MSTITETPAPSTVVTRRRVGLLDLAWLTWRQHRVALLSSTVAVLALGGWMLWNNHRFVELFQNTPQYLLVGQTYLDSLTLGRYQLDMVAGFAGLIAVFWAAPLLAREYEQRTHLLVWSQDVAQRQWLAGKLLTLGSAAAGLALLLGVLADHTAGALASVHDGHQLSSFAFEAYPLLQLGYAVFGFALGLLCSAVFRNLLTATTITLVVFVAVRMVVALVRFDYLPLVRQIFPFTTFFEVSDHGQAQDSGYLTSSGQPVDDHLCFQPSGGSESQWMNCMRQHGVTQEYVDYRAFSQIPTFRLIEFGIFLALAAVCALLTWQRLRRSPVI